MKVSKALNRWLVEIREREGKGRERERRSSGGSHESVLNGKQAKAQSQKMGSESTRVAGLSLTISSNNLAITLSLLLIYYSF